MAIRDFQSSLSLSSMADGARAYVVEELDSIGVEKDTDSFPPIG